MGRAMASLIPLTALLAVVLIISHGYAQPSYSLAVKTGDWVEYEVINSYGETYCKKGDRLKMVITGFDHDPVYDPEGNVAFMVEVAIVDLYVNGQLNMTGVRDSFDLYPLLFYPTDDAFWEDYAKLLHEYEERGIVEWSIQDKDKYKEVYISTSIEYGSRSVVWITVDMTTGVNIRWRLEWPDRASGIEAELRSTNIEGVSVPGEELWFFALISGVAACVIIGIIVGVIVIMRRRAPPPPTYQLPPGGPPAPATSAQHRPGTPAQATPPAPAGYITCPYCGAINLPTTKFCQACGRALKPATGEG